MFEKKLYASWGDISVLYTPSAGALPTSGELNWKLSVVNSHLIVFIDSVNSARLSGAVRNYPSELVPRCVGEVKMRELGVENRTLLTLFLDFCMLIMWGILYP